MCEKVKVIGFNYLAVPYFQQEILVKLYPVMRVNPAEMDVSDAKRLLSFMACNRLDYCADGDMGIGASEVINEIVSIWRYALSSSRIRAIEGEKGKDWVISALGVLRFAIEEIDFSNKEIKCIKREFGIDGFMDTYASGVKAEDITA